MDQQEYARTSAAYLRFANEEARDRSALYDELAIGMNMITAGVSCVHRWTNWTRPSFRAW
jgi:hypothetical protein